MLLPRVPAGSGDAGCVLLSVNELTVCLDARTWHYFLNCSQAACHRQLVNLGPVNKVLNPVSREVAIPPLWSSKDITALSPCRPLLCILLIMFPYPRFYLSIDSMRSQNWKGRGKKWSWPDLRLTVHLPGGTEEDDYNFSPNIRSLGCLSLQPDTSHRPLRSSNSPWEAASVSAAQEISSFSLYFLPLICSASSSSAPSPSFSVTAFPSCFMNSSFLSKYSQGTESQF